MPELDTPQSETAETAGSAEATPPTLSQVAAAGASVGNEAEAEAPNPNAEDDGASEGAAEPASDGSAQSPADASEPEVAFSWQASEFVHHHKSILWYVVVLVLTLGLSAVAVWLHLWLEVGVFLIMGAAIFVYASKPPRTLLYELSSAGVHIDEKLYSFNDIRSFSVFQDEEWHSIDLEPAKRFSPRLVLLFDPKNFDEIVGHLERHLPREDRDLDFIEKITRKVRF